MRGVKIKVTPDDLYQKYMEKMTMHPHDSRSWDFHFVSYFFSVLLIDCRKSLFTSKVGGGYGITSNVQRDCTFVLQGLSVDEAIGKGNTGDEC